MPMNQPRLQALDLILTSRELQHQAAQEGSTQRAYSPSAMTATTFTAVGVAAATVGQWVVPEDGDCKNQPRRVISQSGGVGTVDAGWNSTTGCTKIRAWDPADVPARLTGSGSTTTSVSSLHQSKTNEPDDWCVGDGSHLVFFGGQNAGKAVLITDFVSGTGTFTHAAITSTIAEEVALIAKQVRPEGPVSVKVDQGTLARTVVGFISPAPSVPTTVAGTYDMTLSVRPIGTGSTTAGGAPTHPVEMGTIIEDFCSVTKGLGSSVGAGAMAANVIAVATGEGSRFAVNELILLPTGEVAQVRSVSGDNVTVGAGHVADQTLVINTNEIITSAYYVRRETGHFSRAWHIWGGGKTHLSLGGCCATVNIQITRDNLVLWKFAYQAAEAKQYNVDRYVARDAALPIKLPDNHMPRDSKAGRCLLGGVRVQMRDLNLNLGLKPVLRSGITGLNGSAGCVYTNEAITGTFTIWSDEDDIASFENIVDRLQRGVAMDFLYQVGSAKKETWAMCLPALQLSKAVYDYQDGIGVLSCEFTALKPQEVPGSTYSESLKDWTCGWM